MHQLARVHAKALATRASQVAQVARIIAVAGVVVLGAGDLAFKRSRGESSSDDPGAGELLLLRLQLLLATIVTRIILVEKILKANLLFFFKYFLVCISTVELNI